MIVFDTNWGSRCEQPKDGDRTCPGGEILVKTLRNGKDYCIDNEWREGWEKSVPSN